MLNVKSSIAACRLSPMIAYHRPYPAALPLIRLLKRALTSLPMREGLGGSLHNIEASIFMN